MSQFMPAPASFPQPQLRAVRHPDMSSLITHFTDRGRPSCVPASIRAMTACRRLESILWEGHLRAFVTYSGGDPAVCFTEATVPGLQFLINELGYQPWGLVFERQGIYDCGGGPVWYARESEYYALRDLASDRMRAWAVKLDAERSDWLEEREWRIPAERTAVPLVPLAGLRLYAVIIGDSAWNPARWEEHPGPDDAVSALTWWLPGVLAGVRRWWWNPATRMLGEYPPLL